MPILRDCQAKQNDPRKHTKLNWLRVRAISCDFVDRFGITNPRRGLSILRLGLSHLTVIRTHKFFDHLLSSVERMIREKGERVNKNFLRWYGTARGSERVARAEQSSHAKNEARALALDTRSLPRAVLYQFTLPDGRASAPACSVKTLYARPHKPSADAQRQKNRPARDSPTHRE